MVRSNLVLCIALSALLTACQDKPEATDAPGMDGLDTGVVDGDDGGAAGDDGGGSVTDDGATEDTGDATSGGFSATAPDDVEAGAPFEVTVRWTDDAGDDVDGAVSLSVSPSEGVTVDGLAVTLTLAGDYTLTAAAEGVQDVMAVGVYAAAADAIDLVVDAEIEAGSVVTPEWSVTDAWGNPVAAVVNLSASPDGITIVGDSLETGAAGFYTLTAQVDGTAVFENRGIEVVPGPAESLIVSASTDDAEVGDSVTLSVTAEDAWGNALGVDDVDWSSSPASGAVFTDTGVTFEADGSYTLTASTGGITDSAGPITVDSNGPLITLSSPARAEYIEGDEVTISGMVTDGVTGVASFTINGAAVSVDSGGDFSTTVDLTEGVNVIELAASDADGNGADALVGVMAGVFIEDGAVIPDLIELRMDDSGLGKMGAVVSDGVSLDGLEDSLSSANPVFDRSYSCGGADSYITADFESMDMRDLSATLNGTTGKLRVVTTMEGLVIDLGGSYDYCSSGPYDLDNSVTADVAVTTTLYVVAEGDGEVRATVDSSTVSISNFESDFEDDALLSAMAGAAGVDLDEEVQAAMEAAAVDAVEAALPGAVSDGLTAFAISEVVDLGGAQMTLDAWIADIALDADGMTLQLEGTSDAVDVAESAPETPGSLYVTEVRPDLTGLGADMSFGLSLTTFDRMLHAAWQGGAFDQTITNEEMGLDDSLVGLIFAGATSLELRISGAMAPVMSEGTGSEMYDFDMGELAVEAYGDVDGVVTHLASMAAHAVGTVELRLNGAGEIVMSTTLSDTRFDVLPDGAGEVADAEALEGLIDTFGGALTDGIIPSVTLALPGVAGLSVDPYGVSIVDDTWAAVECAVE